MLNFKKFLLEAIDSDNLDATIKRFKEICNFELITYYGKAGSPVFALALYHLLNKKAELYSLSDDESEDLHIIVKYNDLYWDINGKGTNLEEKEKSVPIIGNKKWNKTQENEVITLINSTSEVLDVFNKLKNIYTEKHFE